MRACCGPSKRAVHTLDARLILPIRIAMHKAPARVSWPIPNATAPVTNKSKSTNPASI